MSPGWGHLITGMDPSVGHLNGILARVEGNLSNNFKKVKCPGGCPGGGMLKLRFDQYITKRFLIPICFVFFVISRCVAAYYWNFKILERFEKKGWQNDVCLNVYTINTVLLMVFAHSLFLHQKSEIQPQSADSALQTKV